jgi:predicted nucleic acid-binding protein
MNSVFLDTNFFLDVIDAKRERHVRAKEALEYLLAEGVELYASSDIIATVSYFLQKKLDLKSSVVHVDVIVRQVEVLVADNADFVRLNQIILNEIEKNRDLKIDYEDCMQLFLANKYQVQNILTSDKKFCAGIVDRFFVNVVGLEDFLGKRGL